MRLDQEFYTIREITQITGATSRTVQRHIHQGYLKAHKLGPGKTSPYRVSQANLAAYLQQLGYKIETGR